MYIKEKIKPPKNTLVGRAAENRNKVDKLLRKEITKANNKDKFITSNKISFIVEDKLRLFCLYEPFVYGPHFCTECQFSLTTAIFPFELFVSNVRPNSSGHAVLATAKCNLDTP